MSVRLRAATSAGIELVELAEIGEHFARRQPLVELCVARQEADAALGDDRLGVDVDAVDPHLAAIGRQDAGQHPQRRGLAGAVRARAARRSRRAAPPATRRSTATTSPKRLPSERASRPRVVSIIGLQSYGCPEPRGAAQMAADFSGIRKVLPARQRTDPQLRARHARTRRGQGAAGVDGRRARRDPAGHRRQGGPHRRPRAIGDAARPRPRAGRLPPRPGPRT